MKTRIKDYYLNLLVLAVLAATGGAVNIALNKPANQVSEEGSGNHSASRAVNGVKTARDSNQINDYSQTGRLGNVKWWKVDLEGEYFIKNVIIYNRLDCCQDYLSNVYILTSSVVSPAQPSPVSDDWIIRHYKHGQVPNRGSGDDENFNLYTTDKVRHVAVYLHHSEPLTLREVEIYNYSHSGDAPVNQIVPGTAAKFSGTVTSPEAAVDGNTDMFSAPFTTVNSQSSWVVKLKQSCGSFCYVRVYPRLVKNQFNDAGFTKLSWLLTLTYDGQTLPGQNANVWTDNCDFYVFPQKGPVLQICEATAIWFIRLVNSGQGQAQFTEVQVFSREPAEFQSINLQNQNYGCVNISTSPATVDRATSYRFKCAGKDWSDRSSSTYLQSCGHEPGSPVACEVVAVGEGGINQSKSASVNLADCQAPSNASFTVRDIGANADQSYRIIKISKIMVEFIRCNSLISLGINVNEKNGDNVRNATRTTDLYQDEAIGDLKAYTDYTVYITAINNRRKISYSIMEVKTGELAPGPITALTVQGSSSSCVNVGWSVPNKPNGVITSYKINCTNKAEMDESGKSQEVCDYNPYQTVTCTVRAVNSYSGGQLTTANGLTWCDKPSTPTFRLSQGTSGSPPRRFITVTNIAVEKINCRSLTRTNIKVYKGSVVVYDQQFNNQNSRNVSGLDGVTQYRIAVTVSNDGSGGQTESVPGERNIATGQLPPGPVASLTIIGHNSECVNVNWTPPDKLSGAITSYKINCTSKAEVSQSETSLRVCGYNPYQSVTCTVRPVNDFSDGEQKTATGNTYCDKPSAPTFRLSQGTSGSPLRRFITASDISVEKINCRQLNQTSIKVYKEGSVIVYDEQFNNQNNRIISDLDAVTEYSVVVTVSNDRIGGTTESDPEERTITTDQLPPGVVSSVSIWSSSPNCVNLSWSEPAQPNGVIRSYSVKCGGKNVKNLNEQVRTTSECGFDPYQNVTCTIRALNNYTGVLTSRNTLTQCDNPKPPNFALYESLNADKSKRVIQVSGIRVEELKCESLDKVEVTLLNRSDLIYQRSLPAANTSGWFVDLTAITNFTVKLIAVNNQGNRSQPTTKYITTGELAPWSPPDRIGLDLLNSTCGLLTWDEPLQPNGIILYYQVICNNEGKEIEESLAAAREQYQFCGLKSASLVECSVRANNTIGWSPSGTAQGYTTPELKDPLQLPELKPATDGIDIQISAVSFTNNETVIEYYQIIVEIVRGNGVSMRKRRSTDESLVNIDTLYNSATAQTKNLTYYIAARLYNQTGDLISFTCGDNQTYGGYYNQPLETAISYKIHYTYSVMLGDKLIAYPYITSQVLTLQVEPSAPTEQVSDLAALSVLAVLVAVPVIIIVVIRKRRLPREVKKKPGDDIDRQSMIDLPVISPSPRPSNGRISSVNNTVYENVQQPPAVRTKSSVLTFEKSVIKKYVENGGKTRDEQYAEIEALPKGVMNAARAEENKGKNRYKGLYPVDDHRVILKDNPGRTDYINASYLSGYHSRNEHMYIAATAPKKETMHDFWVMIWEQNIEVIVMLTQLIEEGKEKCERYWPQPLKTSAQFGDCNVTWITEENWADFIIRKFHIQHKDRGHRKLTQYHYLTWPDHGVPKHTAPFVMFYNLIVEREHGFHTDNPILIHCSAGVGRTGTFIGLDYLVAQGKAEGKVDFDKCVRIMRLHRPAMVQKKEQYHFLHAALLDYLMTDQFVTDSNVMVQKLSSYSHDPEQSVITEEYMDITEQLLKRTPDYSSGSERKMREKNADPEVLPDDLCRIYLNNAPSDYINAVIVPSFKNSEKFIVTQVPLTKTIRDFWVMIHERKISNIVQLETTEVEFLPPNEDEPLRLKDITVKFVETFRSSCLEIITVQLSDSDNPEQDERLITVYRYTDWNVSTPDEQSLIKMHSEIREYIEDHSATYLVMCRNGALKSGLYVNLYNILEKLEFEQMVDVYRSVLSTKLIRPQFIPDIASYIHLYEIINQFVENFSEYSNFK